MTSDRKIAVAVLAALAVLTGIVVMINAASAPFMADRGQALWRLFAMNTAGGLLTTIGGLVALGSVATRSKIPALLAGLGFLGLAAYTLIALMQTYNLVGGRDSTVSFLLVLGLGFTALAISPEVGSTPVPGASAR